MEKDKEKTIVIFKKFGNGPINFGNGHIIALFPELPGDSDRYTCSSYMHVGQHGAASMDLFRNLETPETWEYASLQAELESIGYVLDIRRKVSQKMNKARYSELEREEA